MSGQTERPKIGLVLSGGSAHGLSHIGVLKVLEEQGLKVDFVTGTSIGSIIGGLYAMGLSASEIQKLTEAQDWSELLTTEVPLDEIAPSEKLYHNKFPVTLEFRDGGLKLPQGFFSSQKLDLLLNRLFSPAYDISDFNELPIPYKCAAVNIENGDVEILTSGYLGDAIRSSMAIPSVFAPVEVDGKLLVDGGLIRNFPVQEAIEMGADIIIGVYVGHQLETKDKLNNLIEILNQSAFMMGVLDSEEQKKQVDILIEPKVKHLPNFGFDNSDILIREGYIAATNFVDEIKMLAEQQKQFDIPAIKPLESVNTLFIQDTEVPQIRSPFDKLAHFKYGNVTKGNVTLENIERGIMRIYGTKHFDNINYRFRTRSSRRKTLEVLAQPRKVNSISGTFNYMPSAGTSLILTNELRNFASEPSVLFTTVRLAENYGVKLDYNRRVGRQKDFLLKVLGQIHRYDQNLYDQETLRERYAETNIKGGFGISSEPNNTVLFSFDIGLDGYLFKPIGLDLESLVKYERYDAVIRAGMSFDNLNDIQFATKGWSLQIEAGYNTLISNSVNAGSANPLTIPDDRSYFETHLKGHGVFSVLESVALKLDIAAGAKLNPSFTDNYRIGGLENRDLKSISMVGLNTHQLHMNQFYKGGASIRVQIARPVYLSLTANYLKGERGFLLSNTLDENKDISLWSFGAVAGLRSPLGPMQLAYGRNSFTNSWNTSFTLGYTLF